MFLTDEQVTTVRGLDINRLTHAYITLRDEKAQKVAAVKADVATIDAKLDKIENLMLMWMQVFKVTSVNTPSGTPYLTDKTGANMADREAFNRFVAEDFESRSAFFTNALSKDVVKAYMEEHDGAPPPGVNWYSERAVNFRR